MFLFFFQAEDGIRDTSVTGVQTCALPIYQSDSDGTKPGPLPAGARRGGLRGGPEPRRRISLGRRRRGAARSEERRVGKEGGGRVGGYRFKKEPRGTRGGWRESQHQNRRVV